MRVRVRLLGSLRQHGAQKEMNYEVQEGAAIATLIKKIIEENSKLAGILDGMGNLVLIDGVEIGILDGHKTILNNGSEVVFVPVTHGG